MISYQSLINKIITFYDNHLQVKKVGSDFREQLEDLVDTTTMALMRFRQGGFLRLPSDEPDELKYFRGARGHKRGYYLG